MIYLSQMLGNPVLDANGEKIGVVNDLGIATREVFPRVTSLAFQGPGKTPFMISWRKYVDTFDDSCVRLGVPATDIRFSYLQPDEVLIARDLLNKQIVDTLGMRVVRVNDLKLSDTSSSQLRLLGAEVGARGILRALSPALERAALKVARAFGHEMPERIIAWNYMDLIDRDLSSVKLSVSHQTLDDLHPADVADIIEQLDPRLRGQVFAQLDDSQKAEAMAELDDDQMAARIMDGMAEVDASKMLSEMDPDDAAELVGELDYEKAERLLRLMGISEQRAVRQLLGYKDDTAGRIMTSEFVALPQGSTVDDVARRMRELDEDFEPVNYVYLTDDDGKLAGVVSVRRLFVSEPAAVLADLAVDEVITASPDDDQEDVAEDIAKYNLLAMPVVDENGKILGIVTVDDALDVLEEEHEEDLQIASGITSDSSDGDSGHDLRRFLRREAWFFYWAAAIVALELVMAAGTQALSAASALLLALAAPVALLSADNVVRYVTGCFLEYDPDDEDAPSMVGFAIKSIAMGVAFALVVWLVSVGVQHSFLAGDGLASRLVSASFVAAAVCTVALFAAAPAILTLLRARDARNVETDGFALRALAMLASLVLFVALSCAQALGSGLVG